MLLLTRAKCHISENHCARMTSTMILYQDLDNESEFFVLLKNIWSKTTSFLSTFMQNCMGAWSNDLDCDLKTEKRKQERKNVKISHLCPFVPVSVCLLVCLSVSLCLFLFPPLFPLNKSHQPVSGGSGEGGGSLGPPPAAGGSAPCPRLPPGTQRVKQAGSPSGNS